MAGILVVSDNKIQIFFFPNISQVAFDHFPARTSYNIAYKTYFHYNPLL